MNFHIWDGTFCNRQVLIFLHRALSPQTQTFLCLVVYLGRHLESLRWSIRNVFDVRLGLAGCYRDLASSYSFVSLRIRLFSWQASYRCKFILQTLQVSDLAFLLHSLRSTIRSSSQFMPVGPFCPTATFPRIFTGEHFPRSCRTPDGKQLFLMVEAFFLIFYPPYLFMSFVTLVVQMLDFREYLRCQDKQTIHSRDWKKTPKHKTTICVSFFSWHRLDTENSKWHIIWY